MNVDRCLLASGTHRLSLVLAAFVWVGVAADRAYAPETTNRLATNRLATNRLATNRYGHDGRSVNLQEVILRHGGEASVAPERFAALSKAGKADVIAFLQSLILFPPDDTASNLNPGDADAPGFPQRGHGSIARSVLFGDPRDPE